MCLHLWFQSLVAEIPLENTKAIGDVKSCFVESPLFLEKEWLKKTTGNVLGTFFEQRTDAFQPERDMYHIHVKKKYDLLSAPIRLQIVFSKRKNNPFDLVPVDVW